MEIIKHSLKWSGMSNQGIKNNNVNRIETTSCEGVVPSIHGVPDPVSAGHHQAMDQTKENEKRKCSKKDCNWVSSRVSPEKENIDEEWRKYLMK